jgi:hypothetical protein
MIALVGCVVAFPITGEYTLIGSSHTATVTVNGDGTGSAIISGDPATFDFSYQMNPDGVDGTAYYNWFSSAPFTVDPNTGVITSPNYPDYELVPVTNQS